VLLLRREGAHEARLLSVRAVDRACYIISDGSAVVKSGVLQNSSVVDKVNDEEQYALKVCFVKAAAGAAATRIAGEAALWHRRFNYLGFQNLKRAVKMVDGMPSAVPDAERVPGTICGPCVDGTMVQAPHQRFTTTTSLCELVHTDVCGPLPMSLEGSVYFITTLEEKSGFIMATPMKTKGMAPDVLKARIKKPETLNGTTVKRVRHDGAKEYLTTNFKTCYEDKGITPEPTAPYKSQQNGKAKRVNRTLMERVRAALHDAGAAA